MNKRSVLMVCFFVLIGICGCGSSGENKSNASTPSTKYQLYIDVKSETNLLFSTYDMEILLDGNKIGEVANGNSFTHLEVVSEGEHVIGACKAGADKPKGEKRFTVESDTTFSSKIAHESSSISFNEVNIIDSIDGSSIEVPDVENMVLSSAIDLLKSKGFVNLREEPNRDIWDKDNWIVSTQGIRAGEKADKNDFIQLDCISLSDYYKKSFIGKNINEIEEFAKQNGLEIKYFDNNKHELSEEVGKYDVDSKNDVKAIDAKQYAFSSNTVEIVIGNEKQKSLEGESKDENGVWYSTNSKATVRDGNSGIYAYKNHAAVYDLYYIVNFDDGYVYSFTEGNGTDYGDRAKIVSGNLNETVIVTYSDGVTEWSYGFHFKWKNQPDHLILQDQYGFETDLYCTDIDEALSLLEKKTIEDL